MIILDASAILEWLLRAEAVPELTEVLEGVDTIACPVILDLEVMNVLRRLVEDKLITLERAEQALNLYYALPLERFDTNLITDKIWKLRHNFTAYDASYIALSEFLGIALYTKDKKWRGKGGHLADVRFI